jgi:hypothetical protein
MKRMATCVPSMHGIPSGGRFEVTGNILRRNCTPYKVKGTGTYGQYNAEEQHVIQSERALDLTGNTMRRNCRGTACA